MKSRLIALHAEAKTLQSGPERRAATTALFRILLQHVCITLFELIIEKRRCSARAQDAAPLPVSSLRVPADGTLVAAILEMLVIAENESLSGCSRPIWRERNDDRPCWRLLRKSEKKNAERIMHALVSLRNDGVEGHGIHGEGDWEAEIDAAELLIQSFSELLPTINKDGDSLFISFQQSAQYEIKLLKPFQGNIICFRSIKKTNAGRCVVRAQVERGWFHKEEISYEAIDILESGNGSEINRYQIIKTSKKNWTPLAILPDRLTDEFTGRDREIEELRDWLEDSESRACMLYGDGGIGKTTLAIEFVRRIIEGKIVTDYRPEMITFYTAKKTRWGPKRLRKHSTQ